MIVMDYIISYNTQLEIKKLSRKLYVNYLHLIVKT